MGMAFSQSGGVVRHGTLQRLFEPVEESLCAGTGHDAERTLSCTIENKTDSD